MHYEGTLAAASSRGIGANIVRKIIFLIFLFDSISTIYQQHIFLTELLMNY